jgi:hypothetical protein
MTGGRTGSIEVIGSSESKLGPDILGAGRRCREKPRGA